jgi:hypothetical protein
MMRRIRDKKERPALVAWDDIQAMRWVIPELGKKGLILMSPAPLPDFNLGLQNCLAM